MSVKEGIERVKEFLLRPLFTTEELNVVDQKKVGLPITLAELHQITVLDRVDELVNKQLTGDIDHLHVLPFRPDELADGLHQMGLAQTDAAIDEERIVCTRRRLRDSKTGCVRDFIIRTDNERFEGVSRVESRNSCDRPRVDLRRRQRFFQTGRIFCKCLHASRRRSAKLNRTRTAKRGNDRIL